MMKRINILVVTAACAAVFTGCAKSPSDNSNQLTKEYIELWLAKYYPDATVAGNGIYILSEEEGNGERYNGEEYVMLEVNVRAMGGTYSSTTDKALAQQLGTYDPSYYYGPKTSYVSDNYLTVGIYDMLDGMRVNGFREALIPSWLMGYTRYSDSSEYIRHVISDASTVIYEMTLRDFTDDILQYQIDSIESFISHNYPGMDSTQTGFYYMELVPPADTAAPTGDSTIYINYIARRLDGQVYATSIKDTAKMYNIYSSSTDYAPIGVSWTDTYTDIDWSDSDSDVETDMLGGMTLCLHKMRSYGKSVAIFTSHYAYASSSNGELVPPYSPILFEAEWVDEPDD